MLAEVSHHYYEAKRRLELLAQQLEPQSHAHRFAQKVCNIDCAIAYF